MAELLTWEKKVKIMQKIGGMLVGKAIRNAPVDLGHLRANIKYKIEGNEVVLYTEGVPYATDLEYGRPPEKLDAAEKKSIDEWAQRHGLKSGKGVAWKIEHKGIEVGTKEQPLHITSFHRNSYRPFIRPAIYQSKTEIKNIVKEEMSK